jgi:hypothetical protein
MMNTFRSQRIPALVFIALTAVGPARAADTPDTGVEVACLNPESYADFGDGYGTPDGRRSALLNEIQRHIQREAAPHLPAGSRLRVAITDIDMAGAFEPLRAARYERVRIFREVYPPRIKLDFTLVSADGGVLKEGTRDLTDLAYLASVLAHRSDVLRYEKKLLSDWLARELSSSVSH